MARPKEHDDAREGTRTPESIREVERSRDVVAQQQGDGQPENARELEAPESGSAQPEEGRT